MSKFVNSRFQFEIRYTPILNFNSVYKELLSPYLKLASGFKIHGQNSPQEHIELIFEEDHFHIDARWDRLIFVTEGDLANLTDDTSITKIYFEIFDKFKGIKTFGKVNNYVTYAVGVDTRADSSKEEIITNFKSTYLKDEALKFVSNEIDPDIAITYEYERDDINHFISFGPYLYESDLNRRNLSPYKSEDVSEIHSSNGYMIEYRISHRTQSVNKDTLVNFINLLKDEYLKFSI